MEETTIDILSKSRRCFSKLGSVLDQKNARIPQTFNGVNCSSVEGNNQWCSNYSNQSKTKQDHNCSVLTQIR